MSLYTSWSADVEKKHHQLWRNAKSSDVKMLLYGTKAVVLYERAECFQYKARNVTDISTRAILKEHCCSFAFQ